VPAALRQDPAGGPLSTTCPALSTRTQG
jgi:hypothetical protein